MVHMAKTNFHKHYLSHNHLEISAIIYDWVYLVRDEVPAARNLADDVIINGIGNFLECLEKMFDAMERKQTYKNLEAEISAYCSLHGETRSKIQGYTLDQVIIEYQFLREVIFKHMEKIHPIPTKVRNILLEAIDNGINTASTEFALLRGFSDARLSEALSDKYKAISKLNEANATIESLDFESRAREDFVSALSHDLINPLTTAKLNAELIIRDENSPANAKLNANRIVSSLVRIDKMIRDLLDANRLKSGEPIPLKKSYCDLSLLLKDTITELSTKAPDRFKLKVQEHVNAYVDPEGIRRIIENLCSNALKYGDADGLVTVSLFQSKEKIGLSVHNVGNPIPEQELKTIFKQFKRSKSALDGSKHGWGLGLTLVRGIANAHGGKISVSSSAAQGTTFKVIIPKEIGAPSH